MVLARIPTDMSRRIGWCVEAADYDIASVRYRCLIPAFALEAWGYHSTFLTSPRDGELDFFVFVKTFGPEHVQLAERLRRKGIPFALDLCDNIFSQGYQSKRKFTNAEGFRVMARMAAEIVVPSEALARAVRESVSDCNPPTVIPDAAISPADHASLSSRYAMEWTERGGRLMDHWRQGKRSLGNHASAMHRMLAYYQRHPDAVIAHLKRVLHPRRYPIRDRRRHSDGSKKAIWFGKHGTSHSDAGMKGLLVAIPYLEVVNRRSPIELVIISNNRAKFDAHFQRLMIETRYRRWSNEVVFEEMRTADVFLMPNGRDSFSACKSANRALLALACGVPVVASYLESLKPLEEAIVLDDWKGGIERYLYDYDARRRDVSRATEIIGRDFSVKSVGARWHNLLLRHQQAQREGVHSDLPC
jgi:glycosyltransferase involved in cell wall biosynthesis